MIIDCHVHILNGEDRHLSELLSAADRAGIEKLCISSLGRQWDEFPSEERLEEAAEDALMACAKFPDRFIGFTYVSAQHVNKSLEALERCIANGPCRLVKLWISQFADDPRLDPIIRRAIELDVPVMAHAWIKATGNMTCESTYHHVVNLAQRYPQLRLWMAHCSGRWEEAARVIAPAPNLCLDISGGEPENGIVDCLVKHVPPERIFFGSDAPGRSFTVQMSKVLSASIAERDKQKILGENVQRWLHD
ncbi:MAG: amidohydrolase family protein [Candidatus Hydrogenedentes bacterium]|nr:amidohydrolase family protein [Candidatus Hydrogenedentota bacterium]